MSARLHNGRVRVLAQGDAPAYRALRLRMLQLHPDAFTSSYEDDVAQPLSWTETRIAANAWAPDNFVLGAFDAAVTLIGAVGIARESRRKEAHKGRLFGMFVAPEHAGCGVGRALLVACLARCDTIAGLITVSLSVTAENLRAYRLYSSCGFVEYGLEPQAICVDGVFYAKRHMQWSLSHKLSR